MPTGRGLALFGSGAVLALAGWALGVEEFLLVAVSVGTLLSWGAVAVQFQARRARKTLSARADEPPVQISVGDLATVEMRLRNSGRRSLTLLRVEEPESWTVSHPGLLGSRPLPSARAPVFGAWADHGGTSTEGFGVLRPTDLVRPRPARWRALGVLQPGARCTLPLPVPATRRGLWSFPGVRVWCADPFGLVARPVGRTPPVEVVVVPGPAAAVPATGLPGSDPGRAGWRSGGADAEGSAAPGGDEFAGLRPYVAGDRLTRLHWPALARTGDLLVRDFVEPTESLVEVVVDDRSARVEESVLQAAAMGCALLRRGTAVAVRTASGERLLVGTGPAARPRLLRALATVRAVP
jgi:uncharacterized protein (DUF58 family)